MIVDWQEQLKPGVALRQIVQQATAALVSMDAERLEELARCCTDLNREIELSGEAAEAALELREVENDVNLLERVLYETRANLTVLSRLHALRLREAGALRAPFEVEAIQGLSRVERKADYGDN
jgi:mRNA degradation ribonuclease J1/J2